LDGTPSGNGVKSGLRRVVFKRGKREGNGRSTGASGPVETGREKMFKKF
jgi:hypothetical protein